MSHMTQTYIIHDSDPTKKGCERINRNDAARYNAMGYGIFQTVNQFWRHRRKKDLLSINAWAIDMDGKSGTKAEQMELIKRGLPPTMVVETKSGYHVYWKAKDGKPENYRSIVESRLVPFYKADPNAKDVARILRVPGFYHLKDPWDPFLVKLVHSCAKEYSEADICMFYKNQKTEKDSLKRHKKAIKEAPVQGSFWDRVWNLDCEYALNKLSGSDYVNGERYSFYATGSGTLNICVNGKGTSCWIDADGRIGSSDNGGPTIAQWLNWFHKDYRKVVSIIREVFPECKEQEQIVLL